MSKNKLTDQGQNPFVTTGVLLLAAIVLTLPIYYFGVPGGNDLPQHFRFVYSFYDAVHSGDVYSSWSGNTNLGFGDAGIRFYPPLAYYAVVLFRFVTESWTTALAATICLWFFVGGVGVFLLARESSSEKASLVAAVVFMAMPYHANQIYNAGLFAEFAGLAILPFCFLFTRRVILDGRIFEVASLSIAYALLILAHLPLAVIGSFGLLVYGLSMLAKKGLGSSLLKLGFSATTALAATAFYWVRMVWELNFINHSLSTFTDGKYDFRMNFLGSLFYLPANEYGETSAWFTDLLFAITLAMIVPALVAFFLSSGRTDKREVLPYLTVFAAAVFISTPLSIWLWEGIDLLQKIQFPWRFLGLMSLVGSVLIAGGIDALPQLFKTKLRAVGLIAVGLIITGIVFTGAQVIRPATYSSRIEFDSNFERYRSDESCECWWPVWANRSALSNRNRASLDSRSIEIAEWTSEDRTLIVGEGLEDELRLATFYYPFWKATINGASAEILRAEDGTIRIAVPPQRSTVRIFFTVPVYESVARYVSLFTWVLIIAGLIVGYAKKLKQTRLV